MEEEKRLPKNIRQMAEKEDRVRVYLEDYVYTFIHKQQGKAAVRAGVLLGNSAVVENKQCWFVKGAVELEEMVCPNGIVFSEEIWKDAEDTIKEYFADCSICGWFISAPEEQFPDGEMLKTLHQQVFSGDNCLMYWKNGQEDCVWMEEEEKLILLKGYYVYYEKNPQMQEYMVSRKEPEEEAVDDGAARNFRKIMKEKQEVHPKGRPELIIRFGTVAAVAVLFVGTVYLFGRVAGGNAPQEQEHDGSVQALAVGASVERRSGIFDEFLEGLSEEESSGEQTSEDSLEQPQETTQAAGDLVSGNELGEGWETPAGIFTGDMEFYKDGLGAAVYRITAPRDEASQESAGGVSGQSDGQEGESKEEPASAENSEAVQQAAAPGEGPEAVPTEPEAQNAAEAGATAAQRPQSYVIQPGDTLIDISNRFYGSSGMVMQICEANGLADVNTIFIGQTIILP